MSLFSRPDGNPSTVTKRSTVDKDLKRIVQLEKAAVYTSQRSLKLGFGLLFLLGVWVFIFFKSGGDGFTILAIAAIVGGYMAINIGANDVANNVGPAVGSKALTMFGALIIAAIFEAGGALIAGGDVVSTISKSIINPDSFADKNIFIWAMLAALLAAAIWVNLATMVGAPVSTTHSIVGGVMGAGIAAAGFASVNWVVMFKIAASWVISPVLGGIVAAAFLAFVKFAVLYREDKIRAAKRWVPVLVAIMAAAFSVYLVMKGFKRIWKPDASTIALIGAAAFVVSYGVVKSAVARAAVNLENRRKSVGNLFTIPLICAAALLSFAHGSNDVANAVGPLAAIVNAVTQGAVAAKVVLPFWVLAIGAIGISIGLLLFGPKIIEIVGEKITKLDRVRAFCVALSASITVIVASTLGLPVSSTHIAVGAVFGVGFLREFITNRRVNIAMPRAVGAAPSFEGGDGSVYRSWAKARKRKLVRRRHLINIIAAWLITVPASAVLAGILFMLINTFG
ncbi:MAG: anion permease [Rhodospirillales bacterium]|jgi:PiT family inorganic phosphate transporter|nr:anion permease [Rhodospirillales bacterium]